MAKTVKPLKQRKLSAKQQGYISSRIKNMSKVDAYRKHYKVYNMNDNTVEAAGASS